MAVKVWVNRRGLLKLTVQYTVINIQMGFYFGRPTYSRQVCRREPPELVQLSIDRVTLADP